MLFHPVNLPINSKIRTHEIAMAVKSSTENDNKHNLAYYMRPIKQIINA